MLVEDLEGFGIVSENIGQSFEQVGLDYLNQRHAYNDVLEFLGSGVWTQSAKLLDRLLLHIRTTNMVEPPFASPHFWTEAAKHYKKVENATAVILKMPLIPETRFHQLNAPVLMKKVHEGVGFKDVIETTREEAAA